MDGNFDHYDSSAQAGPAHRALGPAPTPRFVTLPWQSGGEPRGLPLCAPPTAPGGAIPRGSPVAPPSGSLSSTTERAQGAGEGSRPIRSERCCREPIDARFLDPTRCWPIAPPSRNGATAGRGGCDYGRPHHQAPRQRTPRWTRRGRDEQDHEPRSEGIATHPKRMRALREETVKALAKSMAVQGLIQPIVVRPRPGAGFWLIAGRHRPMAAKKLKWPGLDCIVRRRSAAPPEAGPKHQGQGCQVSK
jgi:ParB-like nuclease domain